jgi:peptide/nickel transport system ATP-binding protein
VVVMYAAKIVEQAPVDDLFNRPRHPYTWGLLGSLPRASSDNGRLAQIPGSPPSLLRPPTGCRFNPRCAHAMPICKTTEPVLEPSPSDAACLDACHLDEDTKEREGRKVLAEMLEGIAP